jgi:hypothetical protein
MANPDPGGKNRGFILWKIPFDGCFASFFQLKITRNYITFHFRIWLLRVTRNFT